jgi:hypothetical protein
MTVDEQDVRTEARHREAACEALGLFGNDQSILGKWRITGDAQQQDGAGGLLCDHVRVAKSIANAELIDRWRTRMRKFSHLEKYELIGELYYRDTGFLRPGKSEAPETGRDSGSEENVARFDDWMATRCFGAAIARIYELELTPDVVPDPVVEELASAASAFAQISERPNTPKRDLAQHRLIVAIREYRARNA